MVIWDVEYSLNAARDFQGKQVTETVGRDIGVGWMTFTVLLVGMGVRTMSRSRDRRGRSWSWKSNKARDVCKTLKMDFRCTYTSTAVAFKSQEILKC